MRVLIRCSFMIFGVLAILYFAVCIYFSVNQIEKVFVPMAEIPTTPDRMGMTYTRVKIPVGEGSDEAELDGFWIPVENTDAPTFLYLHGQDASIGKNLEHTHRLHQMGYQVLVIDYRGFGQSMNAMKPSEAKVYEDAETAWRFLIDEKGCEPNRLFIFGHSLGGAIAMELAVRHPEAAGLITECTFTSALDMSKRKYNGWLRVLPMNLLLNQRFSSIEKIGGLKIPVLLIHGTSDEKIPHSMTRELYAAAPEPREILLIEGGGHANSGSIGLVEYKGRISEFVTRHQAKQDSADQSATELDLVSEGKKKPELETE